MAEAEFKTSLFDCMKSPLMFVWACCVPCGACCMQAVDAKLVHTENEHAALIAFAVSCLLCCFGAGYNRMLLREKLKIKGNYIVDVLLEWCCPCCSVSQEWRETMVTVRKDEKTPIWEALKR